jgi:hypothetical protein
MIEGSKTVIRRNGRAMIERNFFKPNPYRDMLPEDTTTVVNSQSNS